MACALPVAPMSQPNLEWVTANMQALESDISKRFEMLERRADLLEKVFLFVDVEVLNKAVTLATGHQCGPALVPACKASSHLGSSLMNVACELVHRTVLGTHRTCATGTRSPAKQKNKASRTQDTSAFPKNCMTTAFSDSTQIPSCKSSGGATLPEPEIESNICLLSAAENGHLDLVSSLLNSRVDPCTTNADSETALHRAAYKARVDVVDLLLTARADPSARDRKGKTPMRKAYDNAEIVAALLKARADPNAVDEGGCTTLHRSAENGYVDVIGVLLDAGADVHARNGEDETPLHEAANFGQLESLNTLLQARGDPNAQDAYGSTPLHFAAFGDHVNVASLLIESRADVLLSNEDGDTALEIAEQDGKSMLVDLLHACTASARSSVVDAPESFSNAS